MVAGLLLARAGVQVSVLEKHADFNSGDGRCKTAAYNAAVEAPTHCSLRN